MANNRFSKDPESILDFVFDWSTWLAVGETISSFVMTVPTGLVEGTGLQATTQAAGKVTVWLSGGTAGSTYLVECKITTSTGRVDERQIIVMVVER